MVEDTAHVCTHVRDVVHLGDRLVASFIQWGAPSFTCLGPPSSSQLTLECFQSLDILLATVPVDRTSQWSCSGHVSSLAFQDSVCECLHFFIARQCGNLCIAFLRERSLRSQPCSIVVLLLGFEEHLLHDFVYKRVLLFFLHPWSGQQFLLQLVEVLHSITRIGRSDCCKGRLIGNFLVSVVEDSAHVCTHVCDVVHLSYCLVAFFIQRRSAALARFGPPRSSQLGLQCIQVLRIHPATVPVNGTSQLSRISRISSLVRQESVCVCLHLFVAFFCGNLLIALLSQRSRSSHSLDNDFLRLPIILEECYIHNFAHKRIGCALRLFILHPRSSYQILLQLIEALHRDFARIVRSQRSKGTLVQNFLVGTVENSAHVCTHVSDVVHFSHRHVPALVERCTPSLTCLRPPSSSQLHLECLQCLDIPPATVPMHGASQGSCISHVASFGLQNSMHESLHLFVARQGGYLLVTLLSQRSRRSQTGRGFLKRLEEHRVHSFARNRIHRGLLVEHPRSGQQPCLHLLEVLHGLVMRKLRESELIGSFLVGMVEDAAHERTLVCRVFLGNGLEAVLVERCCPALASLCPPSFSQLRLKCLQILRVHPATVPMNCSGKLPATDRIAGLGRQHTVCVCLHFFIAVFRDYLLVAFLR